MRLTMRGARQVLARIERGRFAWRPSTPRECAYVEALEAAGLVRVEGLGSGRVHVTSAGRLALGFVRCQGEAHRNAYIDHCSECGFDDGRGRWGWHPAREGER